MDKADDIKLISADPNKVALPSINNDNNDSDLISESIDGAILGEQVKTLIIPEENEIYPLNYVIDLTNYKTMSALQKQSLVALLSVYGDIELYLYSDSMGLVSFGMGDKYSLERLIPLVKQYVFDDELAIYKNLQSNGQYEVVKGRDITKMRLNL